MSNVMLASRGTSAVPKHYGFGVLPKEAQVKMAANGYSVFNMDGSNSNSKDNQIGGSDMSNGIWTTTGGQQVTGGNASSPQTAWNIGTDTTTTVAGYDTSNPTGGFTVGGQNTTVSSPSGANWGDVQNTQQTVVNGQYDKVAAGKEAIKKLAGKLLQLVPNMNAEEFNEFVKIFDMADIKDEFLARSGRKDSYLDRQLLTEAINEANMVFMENNQKNVNLTNTLNSIAQTLNNTGNYDAGNVYKFLIDCVSVGAIPASIGNDPMRQHLTRVVNMAMQFRNNGGISGIGASGANWGTAAQQQQATWGSTTWGQTTQNTGAWGTTNNNQSTWGGTTTSWTTPMNAASSMDPWGQTTQTQNTSVWGSTATSTWGGTSGGAAPVQSYSTRVTTGGSGGYGQTNMDPWAQTSTPAYGQTTQVTGGGMAYDWNAMTTQAQQQNGGFGSTYNHNTYGQTYEKNGQTYLYI